MRKTNYKNKLYKSPKHPFKKYQKLGLPGLLFVLVVMVLAYFTTDNHDVVHTNDRNVVNSFEKYEVKLDRHIDGDTTRFIFNGKSHSFRYLMIDTPEIDRSNKKNHDPYAIEALNRVEDLLDNANHIYIEFDNELKDKYDRFLVYVYADDIFVNEVLVREGLAKVRYVYPPNDTYVDSLKRAERKAKHDKVGLWSQ